MPQCLISVNSCALFWVYMCPVERAQNLTIQSTARSPAPLPFPV